LARRQTKAPKSSPTRRKAVPQYGQVASILRAKILSGDEDLPVRLPPERDLCSIHGVSRITIRRAMEILARDGLVQRSPSRGTHSVPAGIRQWKRLRRGGTIHVLTSAGIMEGAPSSYYGRICEGIQDRGEQAGYRLSLQRLTTMRTSAAMDLLVPQRETTAGIIFVGLMNDVMIRLFTDTGYPVVCVDYWTTDPQADAIVVDCYTEGQEGAEFLLRNGHTQLFYLGNRLGRPDVSERESDSELLLAGMQRALVRTGLPPMPAEHIRFLGNGQDDGRQAVQWFASLQPRPTAGIIFNDGLCREFLGQLATCGLRCPEDVSLVTKVWEGVQTEVTCLRGAALPLGELAVDTLLDRIARGRSRGLRLAVPSVLERGRTVRQLG
jgi:DNA-binding LacI/PurR family transcriptional regulator